MSLSGWTVWCSTCDVVFSLIVASSPCCVDAWEKVGDGQSGSICVSLSSKQIVVLGECSAWSMTSTPHVAMCTCNGLIGVGMLNCCCER